MYMKSFYILLSIFLYICIIYSIAPIVDHLFTPLNKEKSEIQLVIESMSQIITISVIWYGISEYIVKSMNLSLGVKGHPLINKTKEVVGALIMVGLQTHLIEKLEYITHLHPFRKYYIY